MATSSSATSSSSAIQLTYSLTPPAAIEQSEPLSATFTHPLSTSSASAGLPTSSRQGGQEQVASLIQGLEEIKAKVMEDLSVFKEEWKNCQEEKIPGGVPSKGGNAKKQEEEEEELDEEDEESEEE